MKNRPILFIAAAFSLLSTGALAAVQPPAHELLPIALVATSSHSGVGTFYGEPGDKVNGDHSPSYPPTSLSGQREIHGTAVIYN